MITNVRKLTNLSNAEVPIKTGPNVTVYLAPGQSMEKIQVTDLAEVKKYLKVEEDLSEVLPQPNARVRLFD